METDKIEESKKEKQNPETNSIKKSSSDLPHHHGNCKEEVLKDLPTEDMIQAVSEAMKQLGDPMRLRIFWLLCHAEECVINIAAIMDSSSPAVSHHLRLLKNAGLIVSERHGKEMYYKAADTELAQKLHHVIEDIGRISCPE